VPSQTNTHDHHADKTVVDNPYSQHPHSVGIDDACCRLLTSGTVLAPQYDRACDTNMLGFELLSLKKDVNACAQHANGIVAEETPSITTRLCDR
jgi:hypothetical protein